jgi:hypothetical protein
MNILTKHDSNRHHFEGLTLQEKKQKKLPPHEKILMPTHIAHISLCLLTHKPTQRQSQKSAIANALSAAMYNFQSFEQITFNKNLIALKFSL